MTFSDLLKPREVRWTLRELDEALREAPRGLHDIVPEIRIQCQKLIRVSDKTSYAIRVDGFTPKAIALFLSTGVAKEYLVSGQYHIYRGVLSGAGQQLKSLLRHLVKLQIEADLMSEHDAKEFFDHIADEVASVG